METFDKMKGRWERSFSTVPVLNTEQMNDIVKTRVKKQTNIAMKYFWAAFAFQIFMYAILTHVLIKYGIVQKKLDITVLIACIAGILFYIPFTVIMMKRFKAMVRITMDGTGIESVQAYVLRKRNLLQRFFTFKKRYELLLIPVSVAIGVWIVAGPVIRETKSVPVWVFLLYGGGLLFCYWAMRKENQKNFVQPLNELNTILNEYED